MCTMLTSRMVVTPSQVNTLLNTYHGIDVCGARLVKEIKDFISAHEQDANGLSISKISFVGKPLVLLRKFE